MCIENYYNQRESGEFTPKQLDIEATFQLMGTIEDMKAQRLDLLSQQLHFVTERKESVFWYVPTSTYLKTIVMGLCAFLLLLSIPPLPFVNPYAVAAVVAAVVFWKENKRNNRDGVFEQFEAETVYERHLVSDIDEEIKRLTNNIAILEETLRFSSVVPLPYQKTVYITKMLEFKKAKFVTTDRAAIYKVVEHYGLS